MISLSSLCAPGACLVFSAHSIGLSFTGVLAKRISARSPCNSLLTSFEPQSGSQLPTSPFHACVIATASASENGLKFPPFWFINSVYFFMEWVTTTKGGPHREQYLSILSAGWQVVHRV